MKKQIKDKRQYFRKLLYRSKGFNKISRFFFFFNGYIVSSVNCFLLEKQLNSCLFIIKRFINLVKKNYNMRLLFFCPLSINAYSSKKGIGVRMGRGKGSRASGSIPILKGTVLFCFKNCSSFFLLKKILYLVSIKLPFRVVKSIQYKGCFFCV